MITSPKIEAYMEELIPPGPELLREMEALAKLEGIPIIERASIHFICSLLRYKGSISRILEIGTAIGYSAIWLAGISPRVQVDSIEKDEARYQQALDFIKKAGLEERITLHWADAKDYADQLQGAYDVLFIDAAKGQYQLFFEQYSPLLKRGGLVISDNVFFRGYVAEESIENKRLAPLVNKLKKYNLWLKEHPQFDTSFIPIGDGLALSIKR